ncbi:fatty acid synthase-like [Galleria mellonella]|uniref:Fatty acid synthase-like n=1 Tax=Galleria mellonella TaxID=7137 RepID=A0ABM3MKI9_GALME|nr:fatty acid synthase-like [Galleria mellonella]XP_052751894.1 fatty acid synthase-like [Galleria mellonella]
MVPTPQEPSLIQSEKVAPLSDGDRIVISGMSGAYPSAHNIKEFSDILYNKINPISNKNMRWAYNHPEVAHHTGKIPHLERFDAQFFKVHFRLACNMDVMSRNMLEQAYQAIFDAGVSPKHLSGRKVAVYVGSCFSETEKSSFYVAKARSGFGIAGCNKSMFANRISYWLNAKGPSLAVDDACCSSTAALEQAFLAMTRGDCEAAIVGGAHLCLHPQSSIHYGRIMTLSMDGKTRSFDKHACGCSKSEAVNVLFLQRAKDALRVYGELLYVKNEYLGLLEGVSGPKYGFFRDTTLASNFMKTVCKEANIRPTDIEYVEAHGSAVLEADKAELDAIDEAYCKGRKDPLLVGSVMSNIGYCEAATGISAITKVLLGYHTGKLAANLHYETPRDDVDAIREGRIRIVSEHQPFNRGYVAVNGISVTGVNAHLILHGRYKPKDLNRYKSNIPHLVTISARQDTGVRLIMDELKSRPVDPEQLALLHNIHRTKISGHLGRGYIILDTNEENKTVTRVEKAEYFDDANRPLWFVYSGMGSQWAGMGTQLMRIPIFAAAIERCHRALKPKGVNIVDIITSTDKSTFDNILNSFVGIAAIQIGLTDILRELGFVPDNIIGHSVGELGCAYADGCFTAEEMILSAYSRGLVSVQTPFIRGSMAAVGIGYEQVKDICPPEIQVACHNGPDSCTISGPAEIMKQFVDQLTAKSIFAKEVPCSNIAYHSRYIAEAGPGLLKYLSEVITSPKPRSERWVSTSVPQDKWGEPAAKYSSAEYHTNNLLNPVLFEETARLIPSNAVLVEVAPHGLLQAILKRSLSPSCINIPLTKRGHADNALFLLEAIGKLFMAGYCPNVSVLYPKIEFPVSTETPYLSHLVEWAHNETWRIPYFITADKNVAAACTFSYSTHDDDNNYLQGNVVRDKTLFPFSAALIAVWDTLAMSTGVPKKELSVQFSNLNFYVQPVLHDRRNLKLSVAMHRGTGHFEVLDDESRVATGDVAALQTPGNKKNLPEIESTPAKEAEKSKEVYLKSEDIYQILYERDYFYRDQFRSIHNVNETFTEGHIIWNNNWVTFIEGLIQMSTLKHPYETVSQPKQIQTLVINVDEHADKMIKVDDKNVMKATLSDLYDYVSCGGVKIKSLRFHNLPPVVPDDIALKSLQFVPRFQTGNVDLISSLQVNVQIVAENVNKNTINVVQIKYDKEVHAIYDKIKEILSDVPGVTIQFKQIELKQLSEERELLNNVDLVVVKNISTDENVCQLLYQILQRDVFILNLEDHYNTCKVRPSALYNVVSAHNSKVMRLELARWRPTDTKSQVTALSVRTPSDIPMLTSTRSSIPPNHKLLVITTYPLIPGLKDLILSWRKDVDRNQVYLVTMNKEQESQCLDQMPELDLAINIFNSGAWGGEYYVPCIEEPRANSEVKLEISRFGDLNSLHWVETSVPKNTGVPVTVHYAGINNYDLRKATAITDKDDGKTNTNSFGMEFSGVTDTGERVMGLSPTGAVMTKVRAVPELLWPVPAHWTLEEAATVPLAYAIAFYCLGIKCKLLPGKSILVHGGTGAVGQAIISIALNFGCEVFATVGDVRKKRYLRKLFPQIPERHIGNSRDHTFGDMILTTTKDRGCDIVISCVKDKLRNTSLNCCAPCGITIDLSLIPNEEKFRFGMSNLIDCRHYMPVDFSSIFYYNKQDEIKSIQYMISEGIERGYVRPLSRITYGAQEAARAFRLLGASRHRGRVLLRLCDSFQAQPRIKCSPEYSHLVLCDDDFFGLQWAERLVSRGATKLRLHFSSVSSYVFYRVQSWQAKGIEVQVSTEDVSSSTGVQSLLENSNKMARVEGIYVMATTDKTDQNKLSYLDTVSRKLCPSLKYFCVVNTNGSGQETCLVRAANNLPATKLTIPPIAKKDVPSTPDTISWRSGVDVTERALRTALPVLKAYARPVPPPSLLQQIVAIADINLPPNVEPTTTLQDLKVQDEKLTAISCYLSDTYNISYDEERIPSLTIQKIAELQEVLFPSELKKVKGLHTFFSYVDSDELLATTEMVSIPTLASSTMREDELDTTQTYMCCVPGLEGHRYKLHKLCDRLKLPALVLQQGLDCIGETVPEMAERYAKVLLKKAGLKDTFYLMGYESGVIIALEIAKIIEKQGLTGMVFCVGASPEDFLEMLEDELSEYKTEEELQDAITQHMFTLMGGTTTAGVQMDLHQYSTWREKNDACVRTLLGHVPHSAQYARANIEEAYTRISLLRQYKPKPYALQSQIVLLQASANHSLRNTIQQYSQKPVIVYNLDTPLAHVSIDLRCSNLINRHLPVELLEAFNRKNICETYITNADTFMMEG